MATKLGENTSAYVIARDEIDRVKAAAPPVDALSVCVHYRIEPGHYVGGHEITRVLWNRETYTADFAPYATLHYGSGDDRRCLDRRGTPDPLPSWVPRPPASWLALTDELRDEVA